MSPAVDSDYRVNRLRVRCSSLDLQTARQMITYLLNGLNLRPSGLPSSAVVCIRRLRDPKPGTLRLSKTDMRPPQAWEEAVTSSIDSLVRRAARPAHGYVPADSEAVLFLDRSELLACLARDWSEGMTKQWWWKSLFRNPVTTGTLMRELLETPEYCPGVLRILAEHGKAASVVAKLSGNEAVAIVRAITQKFGLGNVWDALDGKITRKAKDCTESVDDRDQKVRAPFSGAEGTIRLAGEDDPHNDPQILGSTPRAGRKGIPAPWLRFAPESIAPSLGPEHQALLGIGLMLTRAPAEIRKRIFADAVGDWKAGLKAAAPEEPKPGSKVRAGEINSNTDMSLRRPAAVEPETRGLLIKPPGFRSPTQSFEDKFRGNDERTHFATVGFDNHESRSEALVAGEDAPSIVENDQGPRETRSAKQPQAVEARQPHLLNEVAIDTEFGGLFYLINLGLYLGLYGDFTTPRSPGIDLDIWDFVTLIGLTLMNDAVRNDPVWPLLATLTGRREGEAPGTGFDPPDEWRIPPAWLAAFADESLWRWDTQEGRLKVVHGSGFIILDVLRTDEDVEDQVERETRGYRSTAAFTLKRGPVAADGEHDGRLEIWLSRLVPYVQTRLMRALGHSTKERLSLVLFRHRARVRVTETHLEVHFDLAELPIELRIAGLDRDPGWVPAAGRYVTFHYE